EAIASRTREPGAMALALERRALAEPLRISSETTGAGIGRRHQDQAARQDRMAAGPRHRQPPVFRRLAQRLERIPPELGDLFHEQYPAMGLRSAKLPECLPRILYYVAQNRIAREDQGTDGREAGAHCRCAAASACLSARLYR